jgi:diaminopimelate decarboxylase
MDLSRDHVLLRNNAANFALDVVDDKLVMDGVSLQSIADEVGTPTYVYNLSYIEKRYAQLVAATSGLDILIAYAVKANGNLAVLRHLAALGAGADIVSGGELARALAANIPGERIVFSGVAKREDEIEAALRADVSSINIESPGELEMIAKIAARLKTVAPVSVRVNPQIDPLTHPYLATGLRESKFGLDAASALAVLEEAAKLPQIRVLGIACHLGSQISETSPYAQAVQRFRDLVAQVRARGIEVTQVDLGGGLGIVYRNGDREPDLSTWAAQLRILASDLGVRLVVEPGRFIVGNSGVLLTKVMGVKSAAPKTFVLVDAAMNDLLRPALYGSHHTFVETRVPAVDAPVVENVEIAGPVCECGDFLAKDRTMPLPSVGATLAALSCGAYGMSMASSYNTRPQPAEVVVEKGKYAVARPRPRIEDLLAPERPGLDWRDGTSQR